MASENARLNFSRDDDGNDNCDNEHNGDVNIYKYDDDEDDVDEDDDDEDDDDVNNNQRHDLFSRDPFLLETVSRCRQSNSAGS